MLQIGQTSQALFAESDDVVIPWTALASSQSKIKIGTNNWVVETYRNRFITT